MDPALVFIAVEMAFLVVVAAAVVFVLRRLRARVAAGVTPALLQAGADEAPPVAGSWSALAARWAAAGPPRTPDVARASLMIGPVAWKNCVAVGLGPEGLHLAVRIPVFGSFGRKPLLIPWSEIVSTAPTTLWWRDARLLVVGRPTVATVTLPGDLWAEIVRRDRLAVPTA